MILITDLCIWRILWAFNDLSILHSPSRLIDLELILRLSEKSFDIHKAKTLAID